MAPVRLGGTLFGAVLASAASAAWAQEAEPICADRPGLATPTCTVPPGKVQVETTFVAWASDRSAGVRTDELAVGESALKLGLTDRFHVEMVVSPYVRSRVREGGFSETVSGFGDLLLAAKYRLTRDDLPVQVAVKPFVKIPTAKRTLGNGKAEGGIVIPIAYAIPGSQLSLGLSPELGLVADGDGAGHHLAMAQVAGLGIPLSPRLSVSVEAAAAWDWDPAGTVRQYALSGSAAYLLSNDVQLDAGAVVGLNRETPNLEVYSGIALRF